MNDEPKAPKDPKLVGASAPSPIAPKKRERRVEQLASRLNTMEKALDTLLSDYESGFFTYVALFRVRHSCDPDPSDVPLDYLWPVEDAGPDD